MKSFVRYWNPLGPKEAKSWTTLDELGGKVRQITLSIDSETGHYTRLMECSAGVDTTELGPQVHDYQEEIFIVEGELYDVAQDKHLSKGDYACRPPGEAHGPFQNETGCLVLEVSYPNAREAEQNQPD